MSTHDFGWKIRRARMALGLTQQQVADMAGTGRRLIGDLESGKDTVELGKALSVARCLGITDLKGPSSADIARSLEVPRFWSGVDNVTPDILIAGVLKNPTFFDLLLVAREYGVEPLKGVHTRLKRNGEISKVASSEVVRMLANVEEGLNAP